MRKKVVGALLVMLTGCAVDVDAVGGASEALDTTAAKVEPKLCSDLSEGDCGITISGICKPGRTNPCAGNPCSQGEPSFLKNSGDTCLVECVGAGYMVACDFQCVNQGGLGCSEPNGDTIYCGRVPLNGGGATIGGDDGDGGTCTVLEYPNGCIVKYGSCRNASGEFEMFWTPTAVAGDCSAILGTTTVSTTTTTPTSTTTSQTRTIGW